MAAVVKDPPVRVVLTTCPDAVTARRIARTLVEERLAACGNVVPGLTSIYRWQGAVETADECLLILKTREDRIPALAARLGALHPYDVPEVLALPVADGTGPYVAWVREEAGPERPPVEETPFEG